MSDCLICFCPIEENEQSYGCSNDKCVTQICEDCLVNYINHSFDKKLIPKCINDNCKSYYTISCLKNLSNDNKKKYYNCCLKFFIDEKGDDVKNDLEEKVIIERLRKEKIKFIKDRFPKAIALVVDSTFTNKLNKLEKAKKKKIQDEISKSKRLCMNLFCNGHLNDDFICMTCSTEFCKTCEVKLTKNHKCDTNVIDSLNMIKNMVKCPNCYLPIEKSQGCNFMTCANCNTNFCYSDGTVSAAGNHGQNTAVVLHEKYRLTDIYHGDNQEIINFLLMISNYEPKDPTYKQITSLLKKYYCKSDDNDDVYAYGLSRELDKYVKQSNIKKKYFQIINNIEELLKDPDNTDIICITHLTKINDLCKTLK